MKKKKKWALLCFRVTILYHRPAPCFILLQINYNTCYRNSLEHHFACFTSPFRGLSFSFVTYGSDLLVKVWCVFTVLPWRSHPGYPVWSMFFVDNPRKGFQVIVKLHTKKDISHFFLHLVLQDSAQELFRHTISPYLGVSWIEFQFCCLRTRFVGQGVFCFHSVGFGGSWTFTVIRRHMMSHLIYSFISFRTHYSF
jgi:hypothetical protein